MREHAEHRGWNIVMAVEDVGSGVRERLKREDLTRAARRRALDLIPVWRLDRWGRSLVDLVTTLQELTALQVGFVSLSEALDLTTPSSRALAGMLAVFAEFERDIPRDRVKAGIAQARNEGRPTVGRRRSPDMPPRSKAFSSRVSTSGRSPSNSASAGLPSDDSSMSSRPRFLSVHCFSFRGRTPSSFCSPRLRGSDRRLPL